MNLCLKIELENDFEFDFEFEFELEFKFEFEIEFEIQINFESEFEFKINPCMKSINKKKFFEKKKFHFFAFFKNLKNEFPSSLYFKN